MEALKEKIECYKNKMKIIYGSSIYIRIENGEVVLERVENYSDSKFIVPNFITIIGGEVFNRSRTLEEVEIGINTHKLCDRAFNSCVGLRIVKLNNVVDIGREAFCSCVNLRELDCSKVKRLGYLALCGCNSIKSLNISSIENIEEYACSYCEGLKSIELPNRLSCLSEYVFYSCIELERIKIPEGIDKVDSNAFSYCNKLKHIEISRGVKNIDKHAFLRCDNVKEVIFHKDTRIHMEAFVDNKENRLMDNCNTIELDGGYIKLLRVGD